MPRLTLLEKKQAKEKAKRSLPKESSSSDQAIDSSSRTLKTPYKDWKRHQSVESKQAILDELENDPMDLFNGTIIQGLIDTTVQLGRLKYADPTNSLYDQMYRSVNSVAANLIEGRGRPNNGNRTSFYFYARASAYESLVHNQCLGLPYKSQLVTVIDFLNNLLRSQVSSNIDYLNKANDPNLL